MGLQCSICSDLYSEEADVAAVVKCGHTFHNACLSQWLEQSKTCPQCRDRITQKGIIHKLFYTTADDEPQKNGSDSVRLTNENNSLKLEILKKNQEKGDLVAEKAALQGELDKLNEAKQKIERAYKMEKTTGSSLRKELAQHQQQLQTAALAIEDAKQVRHQMETLTSVQSVVSGLECDIQDMISSNSNTKQLATWCAVLKKEHSTKRAECKALQLQLEKLKRDLMVAKRDLRVKTSQLDTSKEQLNQSEEDLKRVEQETTSLKKKLSALENAVGSPNNTAASFAHRLIHESPAPMPLTKRPRLSEPDLNQSLDLFSDTDSVDSCGPSPRTKTQRACDEYGTRFVKISSAAGTSGDTRQPSRPVQEVTNSLPQNMNIFKKRPGETGMLIKGYNGLGGHERFVQPQGRPLLPKAGKKSVRQPAITKKRNLGPAPALPTLDSFM